MKGTWTFMAAGAALGLAAIAPTRAPAAAADEIEDAGNRLGSMITSRLRAGGPFFTAEEQAVINQACGYAPGEWDGFEINMSDGRLTCTNGRRVDTPEVRRVLAAAEPRIERRVEEVMESAEVRGAIARISAEATARAHRAIAAAFPDDDDED